MFYLFIYFLQPTFGEPAGRHAEADPPKLHRVPGLRPGAHGPVHDAGPFLPKRLQQRLCERRSPSETHHGKGQQRRGAPGRGASQTGPDHLHSHVSAAFPARPVDCVLHQLPAAELLLRLHAI